MGQIKKVNQGQLVIKSMYQQSNLNNLIKAYISSFDHFHKVFMQPVENPIDENSLQIKFSSDDISQLIEFINI